jgi:hypothetical protein
VLKAFKESKGVEAHTVSEVERSVKHHQKSHVLRNLPFEARASYTVRTTRR